MRAVALVADAVGGQLVSRERAARKAAAAWSLGGARKEGVAPWVSWWWCEPGLELATADRGWRRRNARGDGVGGA